MYQMGIFNRKLFFKAYQAPIQEVYGDPDVSLLMLKFNGLHLGVMGHALITLSLPP